MKQWRILKICLILAIAVLGHFSMQVRRVRQLDARYQQVQQGMDSAVVFTTMGEYTVGILTKDSWSEECKGWWGETPLKAVDEARIQYAERYSAREFFGKVAWVFTFDKNDKVVGKHRFD